MVVFNACHLDLDQLLPLSLSLVTSGQTVAHMHTHYLYSDLLHHHWSLSYAWSILYNHCLLHHAAHPILLSPNLPPRSSTDELTYVEISPLPWSLFRQLCGCLLNYPILDLAPLLVLSTFSRLRPLFSPMMVVSPLSTDKLDKNDYDTWALDARIWLAGQGYMSHLTTKANFVMSGLQLYLLFPINNYCRGICTNNKN